MNYWQKLSIKKQFLLLAVIFFSVLCVLLFSTSIYMFGQTEKNFRMYVSSTVSQINIRLSGMADQFSRFATSLAYDPAVQDYMDSRTHFERFNNKDSLIRRLNQVSRLIDSMLCMVIKPLNGDLAINGRPISIADIQRFPEPSDNKVMFTGVQKYYHIMGDSNAFDTFIVAIKSYSVRNNAGSNKYLGTVFMLLDGNKLGKDLGISKNNGLTSYYILDGNHKIVYSSVDRSGAEFVHFNPEVCPSGQIVLMNIGQVEYYVYRENNPETGMAVLCLTNRSAVLESTINFIKLELIIFFIMIIITGIIFFFFQRSAVKPLWEMAAYMEKVMGSKGKPETKLRLYGNREVELLSENFNLMLNTLEELNKQLIEAEVYKKHTEIALLRSQINPHFLYNTLESIKGMAFDAGCQNIIGTVKSLGRVFRYSVKAPEFVLLEQEAEMLDDYLAIQQIRFFGRFSIKKNYTKDTLDCRIPKMLLQPLVENAIQHGLELMKSGGLLEISSKIEDCELIIEISDNGCGIGDDVLEQLLKGLKMHGGVVHNEGSSVKIGVINVHWRIRYYFGEPYGLEIRSRQGQGVSMVLHLPVRRDNYVQGIDCG